MGRCEDCKFFYECEHECRRQPPRVLSNDIGESRFPEVDLDDWCGEFKPNLINEETKKC